MLLYLLGQRKKVLTLIYAVHVELKCSCGPESKTGDQVLTAPPGAGVHQPDSALRPVSP